MRRPFFQFGNASGNADDGDAVIARRPSPALRLGAAGLVLLVFFAWVDSFDALDALYFQLARRDAQDPMLRGAGYLGAYLLATFGLLILLSHVSKLVRWPAYGFTALAVATVMGVRSVTAGETFDFHFATLLFTEREFVLDALGFYFGRYASSLALAVLLMALLALAGARFVPRIRPFWPCLLALLAILPAHWVVGRSFGKIHEFPAPVRIALLLTYAHGQQLPYYGPREAPYLEPRAAPLTDHVIFIMDESVSGDLLGINGAAQDTTPYLDSLGDRLLNYGVASAISNLSSTTNIVIQSGLSVDALPDRSLRSLKNPSVFAYLARAGYASYYLDAQTYSRPSNFLTAFDIAALDGYLQILPLEVGAEIWEIDHRMVDHLARIVESHERSFSYVLKAGAHIHYEDRYPDSARVFEPSLLPGELVSLNFEGADRARTMNSYLNLLRWTVDDFCRALFERLAASGREVLVIYTSDHGQSLLEVSPTTGRPERLSHNTKTDPPAFQAMVPIFLVPFGEVTRERITSLYEPALRDRLSQFELFATLLQLAGYDYEETREYYEASIFDAEADRARRFFGSGDHLGRGTFQLTPYRPLPRP